MNNRLKSKPLQHCRFSFVQKASDVNVKMVNTKELRAYCAENSIRVYGIRYNENADVAMLKRKLSAVCWAATFKDGKRHAESAEPTGLCYIDIDHVSEWFEHYDKNCGTIAALALWQKLFQGRELAYGIVHAQVSPSGDGLHIVFLMPEGCKTVEEGQKEFAICTELPQYDVKCHDIARLLFLSGNEDTLFDILDTLYD